MKFCNAILKFDENRFVMCELESNHKGYHKALMFKWKGKDITQSDFSSWARGFNLIKCKLMEK